MTCMAKPSESDKFLRNNIPGIFLSQPVPRDSIERILDLARRAPSGVNAQPWNVFVLQGRARAALVGPATATVAGLVRNAASQAVFWEQFNRHPGTRDWPGQGPQRTGDGFLSAAMAAASLDPAKTQAELEHYFRFFDVPVGLMFTISRDLGFGSLLDYGMFLQNIVLAARVRGLHARIQTGWKGVADIVLPSLSALDDALLVCGMALGYADASQAPSDFQAALAPIANFITWHE